MARVLAVDAGTTGVRAVLVRDDGGVDALAYEPLFCAYPQPGWVETDPLALWRATQRVMQQALAQAGCGAADVAAIGVVNQRASVVVWERSSGRPVGPAIVWQDGRTATRVEELLAQGIFASSMASSTKIEWVLDQVDRDRSRARRGELCFGNVDSWLIFCLSGGKLHVTDSSNASCTGLYDPLSDDWDQRPLAALDIPQAMLPDIHASSEVLGRTTVEAFGAEVILGGMAGDQQAAMFGELGLERGACKVTLGTSAMLDIHVGDAPVLSRRGAFPLILWRLGTQRLWCLEGSVVTAGAAIQWLRDGLGLFERLEDCAALAASVQDSHGVWAVPAFQGLGTPHMKPKTRARIGGLTRGSTKAHIVRAVLEGVAFRIGEVLDTVIEDAAMPRPDVLRADGGAAANDFLMQQLADVTGCSVERPRCVQASALGGAYLAGLAVGVWGSVDEVRGSWQSGGRFEPTTDAATRAERHAAWVQAIRSRGDEDVA